MKWGQVESVAVNCIDCAIEMYQKSKRNFSNKRQLATSEASRTYVNHLVAVCQVITISSTDNLRFGRFLLFLRRFLFRSRLLSSSASSATTSPNFLFSFFVHRLGAASILAFGRSVVESQTTVVSKTCKILKIASHVFYDPPHTGFFSFQHSNHYTYTKAQRVNFLHAE